MGLTQRPADPPQPAVLIATAITAIVGGGLLGATTNAINGKVSPTYFRAVMRWDDVPHLWRAAVAQGIFEGLIYGLVFSLVFTLVVGLSTRARCGYRLVLRYLAVMVSAIYGCWAVGGLVGMGLAALSPEFFRNTFLRVPEGFGPLVRYAWVGGSIWGAVAGGVLSAVIGSIWFAVAWRSGQRNAA